MTGILFDSDFILSLLFQQESTHDRAVKLYTQATKPEVEVVLPHVHYEVLTVCSRKYGHEEAQIMHRFIGEHLKRVELLVTEQEVWKEFFSYKKKSISFVDCANLLTARKFGWKIASFDAFYPKSMRMV